MLKKYNQRRLIRSLQAFVSLFFLSSQIFGQAKGVDAFASYELNKDQRSIKLTDIIDEVEFIRLEETAESLISDVGDVHLVGDKFVFVGDRFKGDIFVFSSNGRLIKRINRKGSSPEEYLSLKSMWMDGDIIVVSTSQNDIKRYRLNGDFVSSRKLDLAAGHVISNAGNYFLDMNFNIADNQSRYKVLKLNGDMQVVGKYLPFSKELGASAGMMTAYSSLFKYRESIAFHRPLSDTVYLYQNNEIRRLVHFEYGDNWLWDDYDALSANKMQGLRSGVKVWSFSPKIGPRYILTSARYGGRKNLWFHHIIDRKNSETVLIDLSRSSKKGVFDLDVKDWESDSVFYAVVSSMDAVGLVTEATSKNWTFRGSTSLEEIASSENPVLVRIRIKDFSKE